ncbi:hypothetical protein AVEN_228989-1 [Araneus ventricosus]|uniref:Integrase catalytic domain-containing protein n=1 Tax=Araneus ventricosus TaxID=182803 RepID=A0A4Y2K4K3_ARAVE|nr:hypothetical protein AVEN_228989-1 [Araneus ventricosus]
MGCQLRRKDKISDRAPITPVASPELPFETVNIDLIGPTEPPSGRGPSDRGTDFTSSLTEEFVNRIGSSPRFSCPGYPASNGLVERWNGVLKNMLHHIIREDPRNWGYQISFLLFAYQEVPNTTTGVSPFRLMYGREARGPLAILSLSLSKVFMGRWTGPGEIVEHHPPHSYKVRLADGTVRHVHVNKIRKYHPLSLAVGVIFEEDHDFGEINPTPNTSDVNSHELCEKINLNHLSAEQKNNLCGLLLRHNELFTGKMKVSKVGAHRIRLKPDAERKKPFVYRIPEALKD